MQAGDEIGDAQELVLVHRPSVKGGKAAVAARAMGGNDLPLDPRVQRPRLEEILGCWEMPGCGSIGTDRRLIRRTVTVISCAQGMLGVGGLLRSRALTIAEEDLRTGNGPLDRESSRAWPLRR